MSITKLLITISFIILIMGGGSCGGGTTLVESTPRPIPSKGTIQITQPTEKYQIPIPEAIWTPMAIGSGKGEMLVKAISDKKTLAMILPKNHLSAAFEDRVIQMIKAASKDTKVVARGRSVLDKLLVERREIPYRTTLEPAGTNVLGNPFYLPKDHPLNTDWIKNKTSLKGAKGMIIVHPIEVDDIRLRELRKGRNGSCSDFIKALDQGIENENNFFSSYEQQASDSLAKEFKRHLEAALSFWQSELNQIVVIAEPNSLDSRCSKAYIEFLDKYQPCLQGTCQSGPKLFASYGGVIGMIDESLLIPDTCPTSGMRDYTAELHDLATRAVAEVLPALDGSWASELTRQGGLVKLKDIVSDACLPRHRRIDLEKLELVRAEIKEYLKNMGNQELPSVWESTKGKDRIPGTGSVNVFARIKVSTGDPSFKLSEIKEKLRAVNRCVDGREHLLHVMIIDVATSEVVFSDIFFDEELLCNGLPPQ